MLFVFFWKTASSAAGPDGISVMLLKKCVQSLGLPIYSLWRHSVDDGDIPDALRLGIKTPICKGGPRNFPQYYRPVTLTKHIEKVFERVVSEDW